MSHLPSPLPAQPEDDELDLLDLLVVAAENLRLLVLGPIVAACCTFAYLSYTAEVSYTARTTLLPPSAGGASAGASALLSQFGGLAGLAGITLPGASGQANKTSAYLQSVAFKQRLAQQFDLTKHYKVSGLEQAAQVLASATEMGTDKKTGLMFIEVTDKDPAMAATLANAFVTEIQAVLNQQTIADSKARLETLEKMIAEVTSRPYKNPEIGRSMLQGLLGQYESARLDSVGAGTASRIEQIDPATPPRLPNPLQRAKYSIIAALTALVVLLLWVYTRHAFKVAGDGEKGAGQLAIIRGHLRRAIFLKG